MRGKDVCIYLNLQAGVDRWSRPRTFSSGLTEILTRSVQVIVDITNGSWLHLLSVLIKCPANIQKQYLISNLM